MCVWLSFVGISRASIRAEASQTFELCAREAAQILGGISYSRGGQGAKVERLYREVSREHACTCVSILSACCAFVLPHHSLQVRALSIPAGSEELMIFMSVKEGFSGIKKKAKL